MNSIMQQLMMGKPKADNPFKDLLVKLGAMPSDEQKAQEAMQKKQMAFQQQVQPNQQDMLQAMRGGRGG